jgi:DMSO/TMAO reductase YedYZ molybdopterin-dependent catalytic subunit
MKLTRRTLLRTLAAPAFAPQIGSFAADRQKKNMIQRSDHPLDLEMPFDGFDSWITPIERFYVRSHHYTPTVNIAEWRLKIDGEVQQPITLTIDDLKKMPRVELVSVMECAGNGRALFEPPVAGAQWVYGAVGNGRWAGVRLADVLARAKLKDGAQQILFDGADVPVGTMPEFKRTIPVRKALDRDTILAYEMNGETLPVVHGFPLRVIAAGWGGDSWVKWLTNITVLNHEYDGFFMKTAYRHPGKPVPPGSAVDPAQMHPVEGLHIKSTIAAPVDDVRVAPGKPVRIHGVAWSGESPVATVDVSVDNGRTWQKAKLGADQAKYGWRLWELTWTPTQAAYYTILSRATDTRGETQPVAQEWNPSGYLNNTVQRVGVNVTSEPEPVEPANAKAAAAVPSEFKQPAGYKGSCLACHNEDLIQQQRLTRVQWEREVDKMVRWGAKINAPDREGIIDYLFHLYGPRPRK